MASGQGERSGIKSEIPERIHALKGSAEVATGPIE